MDENYDSVLGQRLAVCRPHPGTLFLFAIPGLVVLFWLVSGVKIALEAGTLSALTVKSEWALVLSRTSRLADRLLQLKRTVLIPFVVAV